MDRGNHAARAAQAEQLLNMPAYRNARETLKEVIVRQLIDLDVDQEATERKLVQLLRATEMFHGLLQRAVMAADSQELSVELNKMIV